MDLGEHAPIHLFDVHVTDALAVPADQVEGVAAAVGDVAGVQAQVDVRGVGAVQEAFDLGLGLDVAVGVRVDDEPDVVLFQQDLLPSSSAAAVRGSPTGRAVE